MSEDSLAADRSPRDGRQAHEPTRLVVGRVRGLHGLQGAVRVEVLTDRPELRFAPGAVLHVEGDERPLTISSAQAVEDGPGWRLRFAEIPDRARAERLREAYLEIAVDRTTDLEAGAAYWHEVVGSTVRDSTGTVLGTVADVYRVGESEVYVVNGPAGELDIPAVRDVITTFAPERGEIVVDEGVLDLGAVPVDAAPKVKRERRRPRWSRHGKGGASASAETPQPPASAESAEGLKGETPGPSGPGEPAR